MVRVQHYNLVQYDPIISNQKGASIQDVRMYIEVLKLLILRELLKLSTELLHALYISRT